MTFSISSISRCTGGGNHVVVTGTIGGSAGTVRMAAADLTVDPDGDGIRDSIIARCRSAVKEAGATTPAQISSALVGKTFQV